MEKKHNPVLSLLEITPSSSSMDYVKNKNQFHLHHLVTEQRHPQTWNLSFMIKDKKKEGLKQIFSVDKDISKKFRDMAHNFSSLHQAARSISQAISEGKKIIVYGCGSTGRLAKQMESALWRPFWKKIKNSGRWNTLQSSLPEDIENRLIGEMTGGDRALISALEGFEDLQLVGQLQMMDHKMEKGDVVFCITEGGETSSVIGALQAAVAQYGDLTPQSREEACRHLYFLYNNPDDALLSIERSRAVIENPAVTRINLTTGAQAITGSTRMQAATSETYIMGLILEAAAFHILKDRLSREKLISLGFSASPDFKKELRGFDEIRKILEASVKNLERFTALEARTYKNRKHAVYFAGKALVTVFIDCAERSPTFHLSPLDTVQETEKKSWLHVWTEGENHQQAWRNFLGRDFRGLEDAFYKPHLMSNIDDDYLKKAVLNSLSMAGDDQKRLYDFSFSPKNIKAQGPHTGDLGVAVLLDDEIDELFRPDSPFLRFITLFKKRKAHLVLIMVSDRNQLQVKKAVSRLPINHSQDVVLYFNLAHITDPLGMKKQILLKILLNAHSTAVMALMGRVVGNTMTNVNPSNLKLIGRATYLIMSHVNDTISSREWAEKYGSTPPLSYAQANAVLFEAMRFLGGHKGQTSEVALCIIRILEALKHKTYVGWEEAMALAHATGLENYLDKHNSHLRRRPK